MTRILEARKEPRADSLLSFQLKQGDRVEVLSTQDGWSKVRYRLEGDFPVEGWVASGGLGNPSAVKVEAPTYTPEAKTDLAQGPSELPKMAKPEGVQTQLQSNAEMKKSNTESRLGKVAEPARRREGPWKFDLRAGLGFNFWTESLHTKLVSNQQSATGDFVKAEMTGLALNPTGHAGYEFSSGIEAGLYGAYELTFFRGTIPAASASNDPRIDPASVQASMHDFRLGPYAKREFRFKRGWGIQPEVRAFPLMNFFLTNQLKSQDQTSVPGQSVLYSYTTFAFKSELIAQIQTPWHLSVSPEVGLMMFQSFSESPTVNSVNGAALPEADQLRTGSPASNSLLLSYGVTGSWNLKTFGLEIINLNAYWKVQDFSKKFTGRGNRAGIATLDAESKISMTSMGLSLDYLF